MSHPPESAPAQRRARSRSPRAQSASAYFNGFHTRASRAPRPSEPLTRTSPPTLPLTCTRSHVLRRRMQTSVRPNHPVAQLGASLTRLRRCTAPPPSPRPRRSSRYRHGERTHAPPMHVRGLTRRPSASQTIESDFYATEAGRQHFTVRSARPPATPPPRSRATPARAQDQLTSIRQAPTPAQPLPSHPKACTGWRGAARRAGTASRRCAPRSRPSAPPARLGAPSADRRRATCADLQPCAANIARTPPLHAPSPHTGLSPPLGRAHRNPTATRRVAMPAVGRRWRRSIQACMDG